MNNTELKNFAKKILKAALDMAPAVHNIVLLEGSADDTGVDYLLFGIGDTWKEINYRIHRTNGTYSLEIYNTVSNADLFIRYIEEV